MVWSFARRKIYLHIDLSRCISPYFLSPSVALNMLSLSQLFHDYENFISLSERFHFLAPTCFLKVIYPRYDPDTIIINWNMKNICTHSWWLFLYGIFSCIAVHITWKPHHAQCKHKIFSYKSWICPNYIYTIPFFFFCPI